MTERTIAALILLALVGTVIAGGINSQQVRERYHWGDRP